MFYKICGISAYLLEDDVEVDFTCQSMTSADSALRKFSPPKSWSVNTCTQWMNTVSLCTLIISDMGQHWGRLMWLCFACCWFAAAQTQDCSAINRFESWHWHKSCSSASSMHQGRLYYHEWSQLVEACGSAGPEGLWCLQVFLCKIFVEIPQCKSTSECRISISRLPGSWVDSVE